MNMRTTILAAFIIMIMMPIGAATTAQELQDFLEQDKTDEREYDYVFYTCGHFSRDLAKNASQYNITMGGLIIGNHPRFKGYGNTILNYIMIEDIFVVVDPQTDQLYSLRSNSLRGHDGNLYKYYRTYTDGTNVPSYWLPLYYTGKL